MVARCDGKPEAEGRRGARPATPSRAAAGSPRSPGRSSPCRRPAAPGQTRPPPSTPQGTGLRRPSALPPRPAGRHQPRTWQGAPWCPSSAESGRVLQRESGRGRFHSRPKSDTAPLPAEPQPANHRSPAARGACALRRARLRAHTFALCTPFRILSARTQCVFCHLPFRLHSGVVSTLK